MQVRMFLICIFMVLMMVRNAFSDDNLLYTEAIERADIVSNVRYVS